MSVPALPDTVLRDIARYGSIRVGCPGVDAPLRYRAKPTPPVDRRTKGEKLRDTRAKAIAAALDLIAQGWRLYEHSDDNQWGYHRQWYELTSPQGESRHCFDYLARAIIQTYA